MATVGSAQDKPGGQAFDEAARASETLMRPVEGTVPETNQLSQPSPAESREGHHTQQRNNFLSQHSSRAQQLVTPPGSSVSRTSNGSSDKAPAGRVPREHYHADAGADAQFRTQVAAPEQHHLQQSRPQQHLLPQPPPPQQQQQHQHQQQQYPQQQHPQDALRERDTSDQQHLHPQQHPQQQQQQHVKQLWPQQHVHAQREMSAQQQQQPHPQPHPQAQARTEAELRKPSLLSGYMPPAANPQINLPALMQQTSVSIARWGDLQKSLDVRSDAATANLAAQAQARVSLKRDLTNLTQLADAQTKHIQRMKLRHTQAMQVTKPPVQGWFPGGVMTAAPARVPGASPGGPGGAVRGVGSGEAYTFPPKPQALNPSASPSVMAVRAASIAPSSHAKNGPVGAVLMQHGGGGQGTPHSSLMASRSDHADDMRAGGHPSEWPSATQFSSQPVSSTSPSPPLPPQHVLPLQHRLHDVKQRLDRTEPRNKWVVLIDASLRLPPDDGATFRQFFMTIQGFLNSYNGGIGAEVAHALRDCMDSRVFDPTNIKRSQERMAEVYSQWARRGQR